MEIIKIGRRGKFVFRIIVHERDISLGLETDLVKRHLGHIVDGFEVSTFHDYTYFDLPVECINDLGKLINGIADIERLHQRY